MTARERAIDVMSRRYFPVPGNSERSIATHDIEGIESAGLRIVDSDLFEALVAAVRAAMWCDARSWAARYPWRQQVNNSFHESELANERNVATLAHRRAVELLDERGE